MKNFFNKHKKLIICVLAALLTAVLAVILAVVFADRIKDVDFTESGYLSHISGSSTVEDVFSSAEEIPVVSEPEEATPSLVITSPAKTDTTVKESLSVFTGTSDPTKPLLLNGEEVTRLETGEFSFDVELNPGNNKFVFEHDGQTYTYNIRYTFTVIKAYAPYEKQSYEAGSTFVAVVFARVDSSSVTAKFNGQTITLTPDPYNEGDQFTNFTGSFTLPTGNDKNLNLGGVKFTGTCQGLTSSFTSPAITCLRDKSLDKPQIVEIVASQAETFNGDTTDDWSRPTNSYLPAGTLDYKVGGIIYDAESGNSYYNLRCGKRVYITKKNAPDPDRVTVSKSYQGELPEYNDISLANHTKDGKHTYLTFDTAWRAPFAVTLAPQNYANPAYQDYSISSATFTYIDIKFFYTKELGGKFVFENHPLFSSAEILSSNDGYILRLHLNKTGEFFGWNATYNAEGQLVFQFLNPPKIKAQNDLTGIKIVIDAGHGGRDPGATGAYGGKHESERNLSLAYKLKAELENYGATVIMSRTGDTTMSADARCEFLRKQAPDYCISIHHDGNNSASAHGGSIYSSTPFSNDAMNFVYNRTAAGNFYRKIKKGWHYFYLARVTSCPVVLTENGFMTNIEDCKNIANEAINVQKAKALTAGVLDYFNRYIAPPEPVPSEPEDDTTSGPNAPIPPVDPSEPPESPELPTPSEPTVE
ncbi:MAG: N-acetylmuramoyl-L-alanine amidase [Clostridia bacterium]|nr:N-acetylmuramoyl-L-alanine amidase [Clostridia bacterium]